MVARSIVQALPLSSGQALNTGPNLQRPILKSIEPTKLTYTEADAATVISATIVVQNDTDITSAVIEITSNFESGEDVLAYVDVPPISGSLVGGVLTLTGTDSAADYQTALRAITYDNTNNDNPSEAIRVVSFTVNDGANSNTVSRSIGVVGVPDAPVLAAIEAGALAYTENDPATAITATMTVADVDSNIFSAEIEITTAYQSGEDVLAFANQLDIAGVWDSVAGKLTLSGEATPAEYQVALRAVTYENTSGSPVTTTRTVSVTVNDSDSDSNTETRDITIATAPVYGLFDGTGDWLGNDTQATEVAVANSYTATCFYRTSNSTDTMAIYSNSHGVNDRSQMQIAAGIFECGTSDGTQYRREIIAAVPTDNTEHHVGFTWNGTDTAIPYLDGVAESAQGSGINLSSSSVIRVGAKSSTPADFFDGGLRDLRFYSRVLTANEMLYLATAGASGDDPTTTNLVHQWLIDEGTGTTIGDDGNGTTTNLTLTTASETLFWGATVPILSSIEVTTYEYLEGDGEAQISGTIQVSDPDDTNLASAEIEITANYESGEDFIRFTDTANITGSFSAGKMTLTGSDTVAAYETALQAVTFENTATPPTESTRTVSFIVNDGSNDSAAATRDIDVSALVGGTPPLLVPSNYATPKEALADASPGDTIILEAGTHPHFTVTKSGSAGLPITIKGEMSGDTHLTTIEGGDDVTGVDAGWVAAPALHADAFKHTTLGFTPWVGTVAGQQMVFYTDDAFADDTTDNSGWAHLANDVGTDLTTSVGAPADPWDYNSGAFGTTGGVTYMRVKAGTDPDSLDVRMAPNGRNCVTLLDKDYITIQDLKIQGGFRGIRASSNCTNITIDNCLVQSCMFGISMHDPTSNDNEIKNCEITSNNYDDGTLTMGAYGNDLIADEVYSEYMRDMYKSRAGFADFQMIGIYLFDGAGDNLLIHDNNIHDIQFGLFSEGTTTYSGLRFYNNTMRNCYYMGMFFHTGQMDCWIYNNDFFDINMSIRLQDQDADFAEEMYIFNNRFGQHGNGDYEANPSLISGAAMFFHFVGGQATPSAAHDIYFYHNSVSGGAWGLQVSSFTDQYGGLPGLRSMNNVMSSCGQALGGTGGGLHATEDIGLYDYNWIGGAHADRYKNRSWWGDNIILVDQGEVWTQDDTQTPSDYVLPGGHAAIGAAGILPGGWPTTGIETMVDLGANSS